MHHQLKLALAAVVGSLACTQSVTEAQSQPIIYSGKSIQLTVKLPSGHYQTNWFDTKTGNIAQTESVEVTSADAWKCSAPAFEDDIALGITKVK
jgi:hypothetical protein